MPNRSRDWFAQAEHDLEQAIASHEDRRHDWACFAAHQASEKAARALHLALGQEAWGYATARLLGELPVAPPRELIEQARVLDNYYIPAGIRRHGFRKRSRLGGDRQQERPSPA